MKKENIDLVLPFDQLCTDDCVIGVVCVERVEVAVDLRPYMKWHHYVIVLTNGNEIVNRTPTLVENDRDMRIIIELVPIQGLLEANDVKYYDVKRLLSLGTIKFDSDGRVLELQRSLSEERLAETDYQLFKSFSAFVDAYMKARRSLSEGYELDAYHHVSRALTDWAITSVIEHDGYVSDSVWQQVKPINPGLHKLYEEFIGSEETIKQRIELVLIACEFSITTNMSARLAPLIRILQQSETGMSMLELQEHDELKGVSPCMPMVIEKLLLKGYVQSSFVLPADPWKAIGLVPVYRWNTEGL